MFSLLRAGLCRGGLGHVALVEPLDHSSRRISSLPLSCARHYFYFISSGEFLLHLLVYLLGEFLRLSIKETKRVPGEALEDVNTVYPVTRGYREVQIDHGDGVGLPNPEWRLQAGNQVRKLTELYKLRCLGIETQKAF